MPLARTAQLISVKLSAKAPLKFLARGYFAAAALFALTHGRLPHSDDATVEEKLEVTEAHANPARGELQNLKLSSLCAPL